MVITAELCNIVASNWSLYYEIQNQCSCSSMFLSYFEFEMCYIHQHPGALVFGVFLHVWGLPRDGNWAVVRGVWHFEVWLWWALTLRRTRFEWLTTSESSLLANMAYCCCSWFYSSVKPGFLMGRKWMHCVSEWLLRCSYGTWSLPAIGRWSCFLPPPFCSLFSFLVLFPIFSHSLLSSPFSFL